VSCSDEYADLDGDAVTPAMIGTKWLVVVDYHTWYARPPDARGMRERMRQGGPQRGGAGVFLCPTGA